MRNRFVVIFLLVAQAFLLGHNLVPHHHHDNDHGALHHGKHEHNSEQHSHHPLELAFSKFIHDGEHIVFTPQHSQQFNAEKKFNPFILCSFTLSTEENAVFKPRTFPSGDLTVVSTSLYQPNSLRGPPSLLV